MLAEDDDAAAARQARSWSDGRVRHWWDGTREMSRLFAQTLGVQGPAWDVYLLYRPGICWEAAVPPAPSYWTHQLSLPVGADPVPCLSQDPNWLGRILDELLARDAPEGMP